jgi:PEP-CTERM motif
MSFRLRLLTASLAILAVSPVCADPFFFSTGNPDGLIATASRPDSPGRPEIESADDFVLTQNTRITGGSFTGLLTGGATLASISQVVVEIYRVFPLDSDVTRTSGPPTFSTAQVPTRVNSPSDDAFATRSSTTSELVFVPAIMQMSFTANNSVLNGIHPMPTQFTGGDGAVTGQEVSFNISFSSALNLPADHYFFVPQVQLTSGEFYWLSAPRPIVPPGVPFPAGSTDLQSWIRNSALDPDWLRVGTDITHQGPFNAVFSLSGDTVAAVPEPETYALLLIGIAAIGVARARRKGH